MRGLLPGRSLFVAPTIDPLPAGSNLRDEGVLVGAELLGRYRHDLGWNKGARPTAGVDPAGRFAAAMHGDPGPIRIPPPEPYRPRAETR